MTLPSRVSLCQSVGEMALKTAIKNGTGVYHAAQEHKQVRKQVRARLADKPRGFVRKQVHAVFKAEQADEKG